MASGNRKVLCLTADQGVAEKMAKAYLHCEDYMTVHSTLSALNLIKTQTFEMIIVDDDIFVDELFDRKTKVDFEEIYSSIIEKDPNTSVMILIAKRQSRYKNYALKNNRSFFLLKNKINDKNLLYFNRLLKKEEYQMISMRDIQLDRQYPLPFYHYSINDQQFVKCLEKNVPFDQKHLDVMSKKKIYNLYVSFHDLNNLKEEERKPLVGSFSISEDLLYIRNKMKDIAIELLDVMRIGPVTGMNLTRELQLLVQRIEILIENAHDNYLYVNQLLFPHWDFLSHMINTSALSIIFGKLLCLNNVKDIAFAALLHDFGELFLTNDSTVFGRDRWTEVDFVEYEQHSEISLKLVESKNISINNEIRDVILCHHEFFDGTGFPSGLTGKEIRTEARAFTIVDRFERIFSIKAGQQALSFAEAWKKLLDYSDDSPLGNKLSPELVAELTEIFRRKFDDLHYLLKDRPINSEAKTVHLPKNGKTPKAA